MSVSLPNPSSRLLRAAAAEQADLTRHRERLVRERDALLLKLRELEDAVGVVDQRLAALAQLTEPSGRCARAGGVEEPSGTVARIPQAPANATSRLLRGPAIREAAVRVLVAQRERIDALHYRRWYGLLEEAGYTVAGKDPLAVFLTQVSRSPVVRKGTQPGVYEVDRQAPLRIRQRLERLQGELREVTIAPDVPVQLAEARARRHELDLAISQHERALEEALRVLGRDEPERSSFGATTTR